MAFPIFGRGRALYALVGKGINNDTIDAAGTDLTGPCTCTIKEQNPGIDMLMPVAWDELVERLPEADTPLPPLVGLTGFDEEAGPEENNDQDPATDKTDDPAGDPAQPAATATDPPTASDGPEVADAANAVAGTTPAVSSDNFLLLPLILIAGVVLFGTWFVIGRRS